MVHLVLHMFTCNANVLNELNLYNIYMYRL
jgi:hypothetical protein